MSTTLPKYRCARCGVPCTTWLDGWKHAGGSNTPKSCGKTPSPVDAATGAPVRRKQPEPVARVAAQVSMPRFEEVWAKKEAEGYRYGHDALEQVRFGYRLACEAALRAHIATRPLPAPPTKTKEN